MRACTTGARSIVAPRPGSKRPDGRSRRLPRPARRYRRNAPAELGRELAAGTPHHRAGHRDVRAECTDQVDPEPQEHAGDHAHDDRHRDSCIARRTQPVGPRTSISARWRRTRRRPRPPEVREGRADQDRAGDGPGEAERLPIRQADRDREQAGMTTPNTHDAISAWVRPPWVPTARMTATGPVTANTPR